MIKTKFSVFLSIFLTLFILFKIYESIYSSFIIGSNIDEPYHLNQAKIFLENGSYISSNPTVHEYAYGPAFGIFSIVFNILIGNASWGEIIFSPKLLITTHLLVAGLSIFTALAVSLIFYSLHKRVIYSALAGLILLSFPFWVGHGIQNIKDVPVAFGVTSSIAAIILFVNKVTILNKFFTKFLVYFLTIIGIFFSVGTRPSIGIFLLIIYLFSLLFFYKQKIKSSTLFIPILIGTVSTLIILPQYLVEPLISLRNTFSTTSEFPWQGTVLMSGSLKDPTATIIYFLTWFFAQSPEILLILFVIGLFGLLYKSNSLKIYPSDPKFFSYFLLLLQVFLLPIVAILFESTVYQSLRHFLFIFPAVSLICSLGIYLLVSKLNVKYFEVGVTSFLLILLIPTIDSFQLRPYAYTYYNTAVTENFYVPLDWETESWWLSNREAFEFTPAGGPMVVWDGVWESEPFVEFRGRKTKFEREMLPGDYWAVSTLVSYVNGDSRQRALDSKAIYASQRATCTIHHAVTRTLRNQVIPMAYVSLCQNSGSYIDGLVSISWSAISEVDDNNAKFSWISDTGESIRISTLRHFKTRGELSFDINSNPCDSEIGLLISTSQSDDFRISVPSDSNPIKITVPLSLLPYTSSELIITPIITGSRECKIEGDERFFAAKISNISWVEN